MWLLCSKQTAKLLIYSNKNINTELLLISNFIFVFYRTLTTIFSMFCVQLI